MDILSFSFAFFPIRWLTKSVSQLYTWNAIFSIHISITRVKCAQTYSAIGFNIYSMNNLLDSIIKKDFIGTYIWKISRNKCICCITWERTTTLQSEKQTIQSPCFLSVSGNNGTRLIFKRKSLLHRFTVGNHVVFHLGQIHLLVVTILKLFY